MSSYYTKKSGKTCVFPPFFFGRRARYFIIALATFLNAATSALMWASV